MGMFDEITCKYPLPVEGANGLNYQTKDTPAQFCEHYEIREDGTLWYRNHDTEDHSEAAKWERANPGQTAPENLDRFIGCCTSINHRWEPCAFTGEIRFYTLYDTKDGKMVNADGNGGWIEWSAYFLKGQLQQVNLIEWSANDPKPS